MKKLKFNLAALLCLCALLTATTFTSCNKDDDDSGSTDPQDLIGKWNLMEEKEEWKDSDGEKGNETYKYGNDPNIWETWTFKEDGTLIIEWVDGEEHSKRSWTWSTEKNKLKTNYETGGTFKINGNTLTVIFEYKDEGDWEKETYIFKKVNN